MLRRELLGTLLPVGLLHTLCLRDALAAPLREQAQGFLRAVDDASRALAARHLAPHAWQDRVEALARKVDLDDLRRAIDLDKLAPTLGQHDTAGGESLRLPSLRLSCATKIFCLRRGGRGGGGQIRQASLRFSSPRSYRASVNSIVALARRISAIRTAGCQPPRQAATALGLATADT